MAETTGLLNRQAGKLLHGFESRPLRKIETADFFGGFLFSKSFIIVLAEFNLQMQQNSD